MSMIGMYEIVGTHSSDSLHALDGDIVFAGPGDDQIFLSPFSHAYLIGGSGNDTYFLGGGSYAVILDSGGHDTVDAPYRLDPYSTFAVTIDGGRHLVVGDIKTETLLMVTDIKNHPIEAFNFLGFTTSQQGMESTIHASGMHMGDVSYAQMEQLGLGSERFWSSGIQAEIDYILGRENELFEAASEPTAPIIPAPETTPAPEPPTPHSTLVAEHWYLSQNPDVAAAGIDPAAHYLQWGWLEGRNPNSLFDTDWYLATNQDVAAAGVNPLEHYIHHGWREGRDPSKHFDTTHYLDTHVDVALAGMNPLEHYLNWGISEGREIAAVA